MHEAFYRKYNEMFRACACANSVYQASPRGEGPGDEVNPNPNALGLRVFFFVDVRILIVH